MPRCARLAFGFDLAVEGAGSRRDGAQRRSGSLLGLGKRVLGRFESIGLGWDALQGFAPQSRGRH
mgnify:CR=1 FL=1